MASRIDPTKTTITTNQDILEIRHPIVIKTILPLLKQFSPSLDDIRTRKIMSLYANICNIPQRQDYKSDAAFNIGLTTYHKDLAQYDLYYQKLWVEAFSIVRSASPIKKPKPSFDESYMDFFSNGNIDSSSIDSKRDQPPASPASTTATSSTTAMASTTATSSTTAMASTTATSSIARITQISTYSPTVFARFEIADDQENEHFANPGHKMPIRRR